MWYIDLEVTKAFYLCGLQGIVSGGYRHGSFKFYNDGLSWDFEGDGVIVGLMLSYNVSNNLSVFAWAQESLLVGDERQGDADNVPLLWTEAQLGAQYSTCFGGYNTFIRGGVESHFHDGVGGDELTALMGFFLSGGVNY